MTCSPATPGVRLAGGVGPARRPAADHAGSGAFGFLLQLVGQSHGWPLPRGGMQALADALTRRAAATARSSLRRARRAGAGARRTRGWRPPDERRGDRRRCRPDHGQRGRARPPAARRRAPRAAAPPARGLALRHRAFKVDYALSGPSRGPHRRRAAPASCMWPASSTSCARRRSRRARGEVPERPALVVGQQSLHDPTRAPAGRHTLYVYGHVPPPTHTTTRRSPGACRPSSNASPRGSRSLVLARTSVRRADRAREPEPGRRRSGRRLHGARPAVGLRPGAGAEPLPQSAPRPLRRRRFHHPGGASTA